MRGLGQPGTQSSYSLTLGFHSPWDLQPKMSQPHAAEIQMPSGVAATGREGQSLITREETSHCGGALSPNPGSSTRRHIPRGFPGSAAWDSLPLHRPPHRSVASTPSRCR